MPAPGTIAAIASAPGAAPRAVLRLSGDRTTDALRALGVDDPADRAARPVRLTLARGATLPALLLRFTPPGSYTGQHAAELLFAGSPILAQRLLSQILEIEGVRLAEPGEFSARAYLAGRLTLDQAEGVAALISARTDAQLKAAHDLLEGAAGAAYRAWSDQLANLLALVEGGIDFTDQEDVTPITDAELIRRLSELSDSIDQRLDPGARQSRSELPLCVLVGAPSAGKSTLFNALLGRERAVTDPAPGTTRDVLTEPLDLDPHVPGAGSVQLADLPGLDHASGAEHDRAAQRHAIDAIRRADLLIHCDPTGRFTPIAHAPPRTPVLRVRTKADLPGDADAPGLGVCALDGTRLPALVRALADTPVTNASSLVIPRHASALSRARGSIQSALEGIPLGRLELIAAPMRDALDALGELTGQVSPDDVIGRVFATFCVGK